MKVRVPQEDGEIRIQQGAEKTRTYKVSDHIVTVDSGRVGQFLTFVSGSEVVPETRAKTVQKGHE